MSTIKVDTIQHTSGGAVILTKQEAAKSWVRYNQTGTPAITDSFTTASITDRATGHAGFSFTNAMGNAN